jgi:hypothetical protein
VIVLLVHINDFVCAPDLCSEFFRASFKDLFDVCLRHNETIRVAKGNRVEIHLKHRKIGEGRGTPRRPEPLTSPR